MKRIIHTIVLALCIFTTPHMAMAQEARGLPAIYQDLQNQIDDIQLTPGPRGPEGQQGPAGADGADSAGGCSATQQDSSVLITCGDGTSGVIAGAGTVLLYPEGQVGEVPPIDYSTGPIVAIDAAGVILAEVLESNSYAARISVLIPPIGGSSVRAYLFNDDENQLVAFGTTQYIDAYFLEPDCSGPMWLSAPNYIYETGDGRYFFGNGLRETLLFSAKRTTSVRTFGLRPETECLPGDYIDGAYLGVEYLPAPEIVNAVYPYRLEQLP